MTVVFSGSKRLFQSTKSLLPTTLFVATRFSALNRFRDRGGLADTSVPFTQLLGRDTGQLADEVIFERLDRPLRRLDAELLGYRRLDLLRRWSPGQMLQVKAQPYDSSSTRMALNRPWNKEPARRYRRLNHVA